MKVAVYAIALNEEQYVERWARSCAGADYTYILDTGSEDETRELAKSAGVTVFRKTFDPWRFDAARNHILDLLPDDVDICIALDMDEVLVSGWREALDGAYTENADRYRYKYVWSWNDDGSEGLVYGGDKIHIRYGMRWHHPVHEVLKKNNNQPENQKWVDNLEIHHFPDPSKSRSQYLPLLELAVSEDPEDDRNRFYLGREYIFRGEHEKAIEQFEEHLKISRWAPERAAALRYLYQATKDVSYLYQAMMNDPCRRENYTALAQHHYENEEWQACLCMVKAALSIQTKPLDYLCDSDAWSWLPYDLGAIAHYRLGNHLEALEYGGIALNYRPGDERLAGNVKLYADSLAKSNKA